MPTTSYGHELEIGDDAGHDDVPECCEQQMNVTLLPGGGVKYTCDDCDTAMEVSPSGLVFDIRESAAA